MNEGDIDKLMSCTNDAPCAICRHRELANELAQKVAGVDCVYMSPLSMMSDFGETWAHYKKLIETRYGLSLPEVELAFHELLPFIAEHRRV